MEDDETIIKKVGLTDEEAVIKRTAFAFHTSPPDKPLVGVSFKRRKPCPHCNGTGFVEVDES